MRCRARSRLSCPILLPNGVLNVLCAADCFASFSKVGDLPVSRAASNVIERQLLKKSKWRNRNGAVDPTLTLMVGKSGHSQTWPFEGTQTFPAITSTFTAPRPTDDTMPVQIKNLTDIRFG
jgi:hypothetical protein